MVSAQTVNQLANLAKAEQQVLTRIAQRDAQLSAWKTGFNGRVKKGAGLLDASKITVQIGNKTVKPIESMSLKGTPVYSGVSEQEIFALYRQMTGENPNFRKLPKGSLANGYISTGEWAGSKVVLREFSSSASQTRAKWTLEIQHTPNTVSSKTIELKFQ